jgi:hypothetical protein
MQSSSGSSHFFFRNKKLIASEAGKRKFFQTLAAWVLVLALALVVTFVTIWLSNWLDENQTTSAALFMVHAVNGEG